MRNEAATYTSSSDTQTHAIGSAFGKILRADDIVIFSGDLGSGKTTFIRGLAEGSAGIDPRAVCSPTFNYLNIYTGTQTIFHFDLYRLHRSQDFFAAGFNDYLSLGGICCIEWSEKISDLLPKSVISVCLSYLEENTRKIEIRWT